MLTLAAFSRRHNVVKKIYPVGTAGISVAEKGRSAHQIALWVGKNAATTEDLSTTMIHYRSLFEELVQV